jgi:outer membrane protein, heavy metal efflux system
MISAAWLLTGLAGAAVLAAGGPAFGQARADARTVAAPTVAPHGWDSLLDVTMRRMAGDAVAAGELASADALTRQANRWFGGMIEADGAARSDALGSGNGYREFEAGVAIGLWQPGERAAFSAEASARQALGQAQLATARLEAAGQLRGAYWDWRAASSELATAREQVALAAELTQATERLEGAGEVARLDLLRVREAEAAAQVVLASAEAGEARTRAVFAGLTGQAPSVLPEELPGALGATRHPTVREALAAAEALTREARRSRVAASPGWRVGADVRTERDARGLDGQTSTGVRISRPLGADPSASTQASRLEADATTARRRADAALVRIEAHRAEAAVRLAGARAALVPALARKAAADEALMLTERGWREGELSLTDYLRARAAANDAALAAVRAESTAIAAISSFNQAQGLLPTDARP